jgi:predicted Rossmann-fold nucleotide-binding protein
VALRGGVGTLSEVALSWSLIQAGEMSRKPLVLVGPHWQQIMEAFHRESTVKERDWAQLSFAASVADVISLLSSQVAGNTLQDAGCKMQLMHHAGRSLQRGEPL